MEILIPDTISVFGYFKNPSPKLSKHLIYKAFFLIIVCIHSYQASPQQSPAEVIQKTTTIKVIGKKLLINKSLSIQINNQEGDWLTNISIPYSKGNEVISLKGKIIDRNGIIVRELREKDILDASSISDISLYEDDYSKSFQLQYNEYPYTIFYEYDMKYLEYIHIVHWSPLLFSRIPTRKAILILEVPKDYKFLIDSYSVSTPNSDTLKKSIIYKWIETDIPHLKREEKSPPMGEIVPYIKIIPEYFSYGVKGSFSSWKTFGNWQYDLNRGLDELPENDILEMNTLLNKSQNSKEKVKILYNHLQDNTRYINVSIDIGGLRPYPARYVSQNKYGDCKALTNYMYTLLKYANIPSYYTIIYAGENPIRINKDFPSQQFNHVILCVPIDHDTLWLENTNNNIPINYLGTFTQNRYGLLINDTSSHLIKTPALNTRQVKENRTIIFNIKKDKICEVEFRGSYKGQKFEELNYINSYFSKYDKEKYLLNIIEFRNYELNSWELKKLHRDSANIQLNCSIRLNNYVKKYDNTLIIPILPIKIPDFEKTTERELPIRLNYPINRLDSLRYLLPYSGFRNSGIPDNISINSRFGRYEVEALVEKNVITILRNFLLYSGDYKASDYDDFYSFINLIKNTDNKLQLILNPQPK